MDRRPVDVDAGTEERRQHFCGRVAVRFLTVERAYKRCRLSSACKARLRKRQQDRMRTDLEEGLTIECGDRRHSVAEPYRLARMSSPIGCIRRGVHYRAREVR